MTAALAPLWLLLFSLTANAQPERPCETYYRWSPKYDNQDHWEFDGAWRNREHSCRHQSHPNVDDDIKDVACHAIADPSSQADCAAGAECKFVPGFVGSECQDLTHKECCDNTECTWIHQQGVGYWNQNKSKTETEQCLAAYNNASWRENGGECYPTIYPIGFRPFTLTAYNKETPCIEVAGSAGGLVEILIETDTSSRICIADSDSIGNVDRARGEVLQGNCSSDGRLHACFNADSRIENAGATNEKLKDLKFYVWCDQNCNDTYDQDMLIRTSRSAVKWNKIENNGLYSAPYYGYVEEDAFYDLETSNGNGSIKGCRTRCSKNPNCNSYSSNNAKCRLSSTKLDLWSWQCDLRNTPRTPVDDPTEKWETRDLLDAATGNAEMWCMYEQGLLAKDCRSLVRFPSDLNADVPAKYISLLPVIKSGATTLTAGITTLLITLSLLIV